MPDSSHVRRRAKGGVPAPGGSPAAGLSGRLTLRAGRRLALEELAEDAAVAVESGCVALEAPLADGMRRTLLLLYPGDEIGSDLLCALPRLEVAAASPSVIVRRRGEGGRPAPAIVARLLARSALRAIMLGHLTMEQRLVSLLLEMSSRLGKAAPGGIVLDLPLSRAGMAEYLAINPDTLSRVMARLKARGLVAMPTRRRAILKNVAALLELTPLADALRSLPAAAPPAAAAEHLVDS